MNIFYNIKNLIRESIKPLIDKYNINLKEVENFTVEIPKNKNYGDLSSNIAIIFSKVSKTNPLLIAEEIKIQICKKLNLLNSLDIVKPGFLNFKFKNEFWHIFLHNLKESFSTSFDIKKKKILLEFVSANPTGPLHVGHCRGAIFGDTLANLLSFIGNNVSREYYINDYGNQITYFVKSVYYRILELEKKKKFPNDPDLYPSNYIIDIAKNIIKKNIIKNFDNIDDVFENLKILSIDETMNMIKNDLSQIGIKHDKFISESNLVKKNIIDKAIDILSKKNLIYDGVLPKPKGNEVDDWEPRKQLLFKSTNFGDDIDRALKKSDNSWTYFANDLAYHLDKIERKYDLLINVLGADHAGYLKRQIACTHALSNNRQEIISKVCQLVKLYKNGEPLKMSKRAGDFVTLKNLIDEVGSDVVRFMMVYRTNDSELDFDFDLVKSQSKDNPVYYVQYAYARISSILRKVKKIQALKIEDLDELDNEIEINIIKKISEWPRCLELAANHYEPHRITFYLYELSSLFHTYWNLGNESNELKILNSNNDYNSRVFLISKIEMVLKQGFGILNIKALDKM